MSLFRVLLIDDDPACAVLLGEALSNAGFETEVHMDSVKGLARFMSERHEIVVTDIIMPEREGLEILREIRQASPTAKIIAMSAGGKTIKADTALNMAHRLGADAVLSKPFHPAELIDNIASMELTAKRARDATAGGKTAPPE